MAGWIILENPGKCVHVAVDTCAAQHHRFVDVAKGERKGRDLRPAERKKERKRERERERKRERDSCCAIAKSSNKRTRVHHSEAATYPFSEQKLTVLSLSKCVSVRVPTSLTKIVVSINLTTRALVFSPPFLQVRPLFLFLPLYHRRDITLMNCCGRNPDGMWPNIMARSLGSAWFVYLPC